MKIYLCLNFFIFMIYSINDIKCFIPAKIIGFVLRQLDKKTALEFGEASETFTHEQIIRRGVIQSVVKYFYDQPNGTSRIKLSKIEEYYDLRKLYYDYYGKWVCNPGLEKSISNDLELGVAWVDLSPKTKDLPFAHFDAEKFLESNQRVINMTKNIIDNIKLKKYSDARFSSGEVMHTIQDFYSHSNWIEMGNKNIINELIGTDKFFNLTFVTPNENKTCLSNCKYRETNCTKLVELFLSFLKSLGIKSTPFTCPLKFYECEQNLIVNDKLISGFYSGQKLDDGSSIAKPDNITKCSHGGILDFDAYKNPTGGINKDSGYYVFSPRADLHLIAANLAINHTKYYFDELRKVIGDTEYANFLNLTISQNDLDLITITDATECFALINKPLSIFYILTINLFVINFF